MVHTTHLGRSHCNPLTASNYRSSAPHCKNRHKRMTTISRSAKLYPHFLNSLISRCDFNSASNTLSYSFAFIDVKSYSFTPLVQHIFTRSQARTLCRHRIASFVHDCAVQKRDHSRLIQAHKIQHFKDRLNHQQISNNNVSKQFNSATKTRPYSLKAADKAKDQAHNTHWK